MCLYLVGITDSNLPQESRDEMDVDLASLIAAAGVETDTDRIEVEEDDHKSVSSAEKGDGDGDGSDGDGDDMYGDLGEEVAVDDVEEENDSSDLYRDLGSADSTTDTADDTVHGKWNDTPMLNLFFFHIFLRLLRSPFRNKLYISVLQLFLIRIFSPHFCSCFL